MTGPTAAAAPIRQLTFVPSAADAPAMRRGDLTVVLDSAWTPGPGDRADVVSIRPFFAAAVERHDLLKEALDLVDRWGSAAGASGLLLIEGVTYWFRIRETLWHWVHERLLWRYALAAIEGVAPFEAVTVPWAETALIDVARALGRPVAVEGGPPPPVGGGPATPRRAAPGRPASRYIPAAVRRAVRHIRPRAESPATSERLRRDAVLHSRFERLAALEGPRIVVLTLPSSYQRIGAADGGLRRDPNLDSVISALAEAGLEPIVVGWGMRRMQDEDWPWVETDDRLLPAHYLHTRWAHPADDRRANEAVEAIRSRLDAAGPTPIALDGLDLTAGFLDALWTAVERVAGADTNELARVERFVSEVRPAALLMTQEGHRTPWLRAGAEAGIPTYALQHGVLYPAHPGYPDRRDDRLILPTQTFVFGDYERRVLEGLAYRSDEVAVSGSPRLDLTATAASAPSDPAAERASVRAELEVAEGDRLLVVTTVHTPFVRRSHIAHMLETCLGGPLPGIHIVIKQHPGERDEGPYRELLEGLARAAGYESPPITVVKDIDLYRLLCASDAHLGLHSTVLTDAIIAGTCNLIAIVEGSGDLLGYVAAGVARPIRGVDDLRAALADPHPPDPSARQAFIDDHFRTGAAGGRIATTIGLAIHEPVGNVAASSGAP
ncbi:MAG: hypothetical protein ABI562_00095 [Chloroflexota bacterium]